MKRKSKDKAKKNLILFRLALILSYVLFFLTCFIAGFLVTPIESWIGGIFFCLTLVFFISVVFFHILLDKHKRKMMNNSIDYYKQKLPFYGVQIVLIFVLLLFSMIMNAETNTINFDVIFNFNVSLTSLNFVVLTFIVPHMKERISQLMKNVKTKKIETKGRIYNTIQKYNQSYTVVLLSIIIFFIYIFTVIFNDTTTQHFYLIFSLLYNSYVLIKLITSIKTIFWINLKDVEDKLEDKNDKK